MDVFRGSCAHLAFTVGPEVHDHTDHVVDCRVGGLVHEHCCQGGEREDGQAELEGTVDGRAGDEAKRPFESKHPQAEDEVDGLQDRDGPDSRVKRPGEEIPEDLGPNEALDGGADLVCVDKSVRMKLGMVIP